MQMNNYLSVLFSFFETDELVSFERSDNYLNNPRFIFVTTVNGGGKEL